jgi:hypothetical protein
VRQRSLFADLIFGYFVSRQSNSPAAIERPEVSKLTTALRRTQTKNGLRN